MCNISSVPPRGTCASPLTWAIRGNATALGRPGWPAAVAANRSGSLCMVAPSALWLDMFGASPLARPVPTGCGRFRLSSELDTVGPYDFGGGLPGCFAAHTKLDLRKGELHAIAYFWAWDHIQHVAIDAAGKVTRATDIPVADRPMCHDFALTEKYVVIYNLPVTFSLGVPHAQCLRRGRQRRWSTCASTRPRSTSPPSGATTRRSPRPGGSTTRSRPRSPSSPWMTGRRSPQSR